MCVSLHKFEQLSTTHHNFFFLFSYTDRGDGISRAFLISWNSSHVKLSDIFYNVRVPVLVPQQRSSDCGGERTDGFRSILWRPSVRRGRHTEPAFIICLEPSFVLSRPAHRVRQLTQRALLSQATRLTHVFCFCYTSFGTWRSRFGLRRRFTFRQPRTPSQRPHD